MDLRRKKTWRPWNKPLKIKFWGLKSPWILFWKCSTNPDNKSLHTINKMCSLCISAGIYRDFSISFHENTRRTWNTNPRKRYLLYKLLIFFASILAWAPCIYSGDLGSSEFYKCIKLKKGFYGTEAPMKPHRGLNE